MIGIKNMNIEKYRAIIESEFAKYGFIRSPLNQNEIAQCWLYRLSTECAYSIGCDVNTGFTFSECLNVVIN